MSKIGKTNSRLCVIGESDPFISQLLQLFAEKSGFQVHPGRTGEEFLELAQREQPALVLLDPELPGRVRGWEAARTLAEDAQGKHAAVIICSWLKKGDALGLAGQTAAYLQKPDLRYEDFTAALASAGVKAPRPAVKI